MNTFLLFSRKTGLFSFFRHRDIRWLRVFSHVCFQMWQNYIPYIRHLHILYYVQLNYVYLFNYNEGSLLYLLFLFPLYRYKLSCYFYNRIYKFDICLEGKNGDSIVV